MIWVGGNGANVLDSRGDREGYVVVRLRNRRDLSVFFSSEVDLIRNKKG